MSERWGRNRKGDEKDTINLKGEKTGECSNLEVRWGKHFKEEGWWTILKSDYCSEQDWN